MTVSFHPDAAEELKASVLYYEETKEGLGIKFAREVFNTIALITEYPDAWHALAPHIRRCIMNRKIHSHPLSSSRYGSGKAALP